jgi:hypothetical protein
MPRTGIEPARITPHAPQTCASTNSATWAEKFFKDYLFVFEFEVVLPETAFVFATVLTEAFAFVAAVFASVLAVVFAGEAEEVELSEVVCKTETFPVIALNESNSADNIKVAAAVIVILDKTD